MLYSDMAPISLASPAMACMQEIQHQCFKIGVPLRTRHREVAPNQYEFAPLYGSATTQVDQNLVVMQMVEEIAATELHNAQHPYTRGLLNCLPRIGGPRQPLPGLDRNADWAV